MCLNIGVQSSTEDTDMDQTVYQDSCQPVCVTNFRHSSSTEVQTTSKPQTSTAIVKTTSSSDVDHTERTRSEQNGTACSRQDNGAVNLDNGSRTPEINNPELNFETNNDGSDVSNLDHDDLMNDASVTTDSSSSSTSSVISRTGSSASSSSSTTAAASTSCKSPETLTTQIASSPKTTCDSDVQHTSATPLRKSTRCRKRSLPNESQTTCPNCGLSIKISDLENHLQVEINKLERLTKHRRNYDPVKKKTTSNSNAQSTDVMDCHARYKQYLSVRTRRERRNKAKKRLKGPGDEETTCPVCNDTIVGTPEELAEHVDLCLQQQEANSEDDLDVEGENNFEEYTWAGQTRIRASSLLDGGLAASGFAVAKQNCEDEDMELDIDGDDCSLFGKPQYTEADLIPCNEAEESEEKERKALRRAVLTAEGSKPPGKLPADRQRWQQDSVTPQTSTKSEENADSQAASSQAEVIESLKAKLKEQEVQLQKIERPKCLICMDWYTKPLTSIQCWHVHCEECWLRTLGTKKLCPQCNTITSPADLRRIYL